MTLRSKNLRLKSNKACLNTKIQELKVKIQELTTHVMTRLVLPHLLFAGPAGVRTRLQARGVGARDGGEHGAHGPPEPAHLRLQGLL